MAGRSSSSSSWAPWPPSTVLPESTAPYLRASPPSVDLGTAIQAAEAALPTAAPGGGALVSPETIGLPITAQVVGAAEDCCEGSCSQRFMQPTLSLPARSHPSASASKSPDTRRRSLNEPFGLKNKRPRAATAISSRKLGPTPHRSEVAASSCRSEIDASALWQMKPFLNLLRHLLSTHEVKIVLQLLDHLSSSSFGKVLPQELHRFVAHHQKSPIGSHALHSIDTLASQLSPRNQGFGPPAGMELGTQQGSGYLAAGGDAARKPSASCTGQSPLLSPWLLPSSVESPLRRPCIDESINVKFPVLDPGLGAAHCSGQGQDHWEQDLLQRSQVRTPTSWSDCYGAHQGLAQRVCDQAPSTPPHADDASSASSSPPLSVQKQRSVSSSPERASPRKFQPRLPLELPPPMTGAAYSVSKHVRASLDEQVTTEKVQIDDFDDLSEEQIDWLATPSDRFVAHPNQLSCLIWEFAAVIAIMMECVVLPLDLAFSISLPETWYLMSTAFFVLDILLNLTTGYFYGSSLVMHRGLLMRKYLRSWFFLDLVSTIPWELIIKSGAGAANPLKTLPIGSMMRALRLLRLTKLVSKVRRLNSVWASSLRRCQLRILLMKMLIVTGMVCHWAACLWGCLGHPYLMRHASADLSPHILDTCTMGGPCEHGVQGTPWRRRYGLDNYSPAAQYLVALQFATALITGADMPVTPGTGPERVYTVAMMVIGVFTCSIIVGEVLLVLTRQREQTLAFDEKLQHVHDFMSMRAVPLELQAKIRRYMEHTFKVQYSLAQDDREFMKGLSPWLQVEMLEHLHRDILTKHKFFNTIPPQAIRHLCMEAQPLVYAPGDLVAEQGHIAMSASFVVKGKLRIANADRGASAYLTPPSWFGDRCLFVDTCRTHTIGAVVHTEVLCIPKSCVLSLCAEFPDMQARYDEFRTTLLSGDESGVRCSICNSLGHAESGCPEMSQKGTPKQRVAPARMSPQWALKTALSPLTTFRTATNGDGDAVGGLLVEPTPAELQKLSSEFK